ncbi:MAG: hypothetical protein Q8O67_28895 [Deltaproteobacteria bacterium]|nr:hypothetical protein [Deltaproteobacteria bacterium]
MAHLPRRRRWDVGLLLLLISLPSARLLVAAAMRLDVRPQQQAVYDELRALARDDPPFPTPEDPRQEKIQRAADALVRFAALPFDEADRKQLDEVIAGDRAPWELSATTLAAIARRDASIGEFLSLADVNDRVRGIAVVPRSAWTDLGRHLAVVSIDQRSRGRDRVADGVCVTGIMFASRWPTFGDLGDILDADAVMERLWRPCSENIDVDRDEFAALLEPRIDVTRAARRSAAATGVQFHLSVAGPLPADVPLLRWTQPMRRPEDLLPRMALADQWRTDWACLAAEVERAGPPRQVDGTKVCTAFAAERKLAEQAVHRRRLERALIVGRVALEDSVFDAGNWPGTLSELIDGDKRLAELLRDPVTMEPFALVVHKPYATLMAVGAVSLSVRATRRDEANAEDAVVAPSRDWLGRVFNP